ncbi:transcription initiation factor TFIID subunit 7-like isoform X1 [Stylophora pistillata]|uniref:Transcription initiation factor TFIID subunit 7 n=1 Tax=Stylophora pistillata TaxID=50429 RepID=A0A2B4SLH2_STYPI|nr:transcription initiation factor TFIID subunit 7-like isoform X1 [Stylophora pistillata]PFX29969.1 Transcription initiation factor TFIID subunit 7 [Stylophora pistillata]
MSQVPSKSRGDGSDLENQIILRVPQAYASPLRLAIQNGSLKDRLSIELQADFRHATVRFDGAALSAKLVDLPCIIESHKTVDNRSLYKTADICQMLVCCEDDNQTDDEDISPKKESKRFIWNHGITGPLKNVRKRRFRKTAKKKIVESPEVEKEVKRLLRTDLSASHVSFEVLQDEEKQDESFVSDADLLNTSMPSPLSLTQTEEQDGGSEDEDRNELFAILQEASSDEEPEGDEDAVDTQEDDADDLNVNVDIEDDTTELNVGENNSKSKIQSAREKLIEIRATITEQETRVKEASNLFLKQRFEKVLEELKSKEKDQEQELQRLESQV